MRSCCIISPHPFWREPLGCGALMRARYKLLSEVFDEIQVLFITSSDEKCPLPGATLRLTSNFDHQHINSVQSYIKNKNITHCYFSYDVFNGLAESLDCVTALELHDVMHLRCESFKKFGATAPITKTKEQEINELKKFDLVLCLNIDEVNYLSENGLDCVYLPPNFPFNMVSQPDKNAVTGLIASAAKPNVDGLEQIIKFAKFSEEFIVAGSLSKLEILDKVDNQNLTRLGYVKKPRDFYEKINLALSPIRFGAGLKIKLFEALANGCRVLATSHSIEGFPEGISEVTTIEDNFKNWTNELTRQSLEISRSKIEDYFRTNFSEDTVKSVLKELI